MFDETNYFASSMGKFRAITKLPKDVIQIYKSGASIYYKSSDGKTLYRVSDHWSLSECPFIASCVWILLDTKNSKGLRIGKIQFKNLKNVNDLNLSTRPSSWDREIINDHDGNNIRIIEKVLNMRMSKR